MLALFNLLPTCDETNRAAGLSGWWSRREQPVQRGTLCLHCGFEGGNIGNFFLRPCFRFLCAFKEFPGIPRKCRPEVNGFLWDIWNGLKNNLEQITCECCFAFGTSAHKQVMVAWCYERVARGCVRWDVCGKDARICGVWCAVGDDVSHLGPSICELIFEPTRHTQRWGRQE